MYAKTLFFLSIILTLTGITTPSLAQEPDFPLGLDEPDLMMDISTKSTSSSESTSESQATWIWNGFLETRLGQRTQNQSLHPSISIGEIRFQNEVEFENDSIIGRLVTDVVADDAATHTKDLDLETGEGQIDLREANLAFRPTGETDLKIGRQILTWGIGDMLFINDIFPKDWKAFFSGRSDDYLKAPSDALKLSYFSTFANLDLVYMPQHDPSRFIDGRRLSYFSPQLNRLAGKDDAMITTETKTDDEFAIRAFKNLGSTEIAFYYFDGFYKEPEGFNSSTNKATFPELEVVGASLRSPFWNGLLSLEVGNYTSKEDKNGNNASIRNSEFKSLIGYEQEVWSNLTMGIQWYRETMQQYDAYENALSAGMIQKDENRDVWTIRLTQFLFNQKMTLSLFHYISPTDKDSYTRIRNSYKLDDRTLVELGANVFYGDTQSSFFGQFQKNNNVYAGFRVTL